MYNNPYFYCPYSMPQTICPVLEEQMRGFDSFEDYNSFENFDLDYEDDLFDGARIQQLPVPPLVNRWSRWENLGGVLTSAPAVS